jgi:probable rRNA maturation factor
MNNIGFFNETKEEIKELEEIKKLIDYAISYEKLDNIEFNIIIVDNDTIHDLNKQYRNVDRPTDVISFALEDNMDVSLENIRLLGDIYISIDKAKQQANDYGHSFLREVAFLSIHGFLHLLGYDHMNEKEELEMFEKQELILNGYGIKR